MDRRQQHNLLRGIHPLHVVECQVNAAAIGRVAHHGIAVPTVHQVLRLVDAGHYLLLLLREPLSDGHAAVVVVRADEDHDGIHTVAVLRLQQVSLAPDVVPLAPALAIHIRFYLEPVLQEAPVFLLRSAVPRICDGVTEISHSLPLPGVADHLLWQCGNGQQHQ